MNNYKQKRGLQQICCKKILSISFDYLLFLLSFYAIQISVIISNKVINNN